MADIDTVLERLVTDTDFRERLGSDPAGALAGYELDADDLALLASSLDEGDAGARGVEQRTSKSALAGLLASFAAGGGEHAVDADSAPSGESASSGNQAGKWPLEVKLRQRFDPQEPSTDDLAAPGDAADDAGKLPGRPKSGDITLKRGSMDAPVPGVATSDAAGVEAAETVPVYSFKQGWPSKWQGAAAQGGDVDPDAAPGLGATDATGDGSAVEEADPAVLAPGAAEPAQEVRRYDITGAWPKSGPPTEDFLTIEGE